MTASNQIFLVMDAGSPKAAFMTRREMQAYLRRRLDTFSNPLVYTLWGNHGPSIMTMSAALAESSGAANRAVHAAIVVHELKNSMFLYGAAGDRAVRARACRANAAQARPDTGQYQRSV
jgi:hypothetical protein